MSATETQIKYALAHHLGSMELATRVVERGMTYIGDVHRDAAEDVSNALTIVESMVRSAEAAGRVTPAKKDAHMGGALKLSDPYSEKEVNFSRIPI